MSSPPLLQRLKDRKLVQWAIAYLAGAWVLVEATGHVVSQFQWPAIIGQVATILAFFGFFVVLVIAWYHGEKGRQWVSGPELLIIALLLLLSGGVLSMLSGPDEPLEPPEVAGPMESEEDERPSIAVLPFDNLSPDPNDAYFADGVQEEIISKLSKVSALRVIDRNSVMGYREERKPPRQVAGELGVGFILVGSARIGGGMVRITLQLIDGHTNETLWPGEYDRPFTPEDFIPIQSEVAQEVALALQVEIAPDEQARIATIPTESLEAWKLYRRAEATWVRNNNEDDAREATRLYEEARDLDPGFAEAWAGLARARVWLYWNFSEDEADLEAARQALDRAVVLNPDGALTHHAQGFYHYYGHRAYDEARVHFRAALQARPSFADAQVRIGAVLRRMGLWTESLDALRNAQRLDPRSPLPSGALGETLTWAGLHDEGEQYIDLARTIQPGVEAYHRRALLLHLGRRGDTVAAQQLVEALPGDVSPRFRSALAAEVAVWRGDFQGALEGVMEWHLDRFGAAMVHVLLADPRRSAAAADTLVPEGLNPQMRPGDMAQVGSGTAVPEELLRMGWVMLLRGEPERAREWVDEYVRRLPMEKDAQTGVRGLINAARLHALSGDGEGALDLLERILSNPSPLGPAGVRIDPAFASLRDDPRFRALLEKHAEDVRR